MKRNEPPTENLGPIARSLLDVLDSTSRAKVKPLAPIREARRQYKTRAKSLPSPEMLAGLHPGHALYVSVQHYVSMLSEGVTALPQLEPLAGPIREAEDEYLPSGPPMSPLTGSHFFCWALFDAAQGETRETIGTCLIAAARHLGMQPEMLDLLRAMQDSRLGLYEQTGGRGDSVELRELITGERLRGYVASQYHGRAGQLWLARLFPPAPGQDEHVVFTTPHIVLRPGIDRWEKALRRALGPDDPAAAYRKVMKYGPNLNYWNEYIFQAYYNHQLEAIFLDGLPRLPRRA